MSSTAAAAEARKRDDKNEHTHDLGSITDAMIRKKPDAAVETAVKKITADDVKRLNKHLAKFEGGPLVVLPTASWMGRWDAVTSLALLFTAICTPYEVAMLPTQLNALFFLNRIIDLVFITDMVRRRRVGSLRLGGDASREPHVDCGWRAPPRPCAPRGARATSAGIGLCFIHARRPAPHRPPPPHRLGRRSSSTSTRRRVAL